MINDWRVKCLGLEALAAAVGPDIVSILRIPHTYCWSPALAAKPVDWADNFGKSTPVTAAKVAVRGYEKH